MWVNSSLTFGGGRFLVFFFKKLYMLSHNIIYSYFMCFYNVSWVYFYTY